MTVGERIKLRRKQIGKSADDLAEYIGVSRATMYRYESGDIEKVPGDVLVPIAEFLHTTPAYLMGWTDNPLSAAPVSDAAPVLTAEETDLVRKYRAASVDTKNAARAVLGLSPLETRSEKIG